MARKNRKVKHATLRYRGNYDRIRREGQEKWNQGYEVWVNVDGERYPFLDFLIASHIHPDEPIKALVEWYLAQKQAGHRYRTALQRLTHHIAAETGRTITDVRTRFTAIRLDIEHRLRYTAKLP